MYDTEEGAIVEAELAEQMQREVMRAPVKQLRNFGSSHVPKRVIRQVIIAALLATPTAAQDPDALSHSDGTAKCVLLLAILFCAIALQGCEVVQVMSKIWIEEGWHESVWICVSHLC